MMIIELFRGCDDNGLSAAVAGDPFGFGWFRSARLGAARHFLLCVLNVMFVLCESAAEKRDLKSRRREDAR